MADTPIKVGSAPVLDEFGAHTGEHVIGFVISSDTVVPLGQRRFLLSELIQKFLREEE